MRYKDHLTSFLKTKISPRRLATESNFPSHIFGTGGSVVPCGRIGYLDGFLLTVAEVSVLYLSLLVDISVLVTVDGYL